MAGLSWIRSLSIKDVNDVYPLAIKLWLNWKYSVKRDSRAHLAIEQGDIRKAYRNDVKFNTMSKAPPKAVGNYRVYTVTTN